ncbi:SagB/ThcOx family dehydrogenase [Dysgonomonas sp. BGC7]|uniref:SagB/ThcOx family dehydrogenase n=1 Tax=Dysgonomonas sp. BGC7 TaxID=1658008 RepID=UPI00068023CA|nr:SagB/ThcOx family dehydrogenase [Dysgonomonas sp. BGC7]MBD8388608.1 SagB/ThcOx family dehydrogenase [Dysgonomonas sp. BGC7]
MKKGLLLLALLGVMYCLSAQDIKLQSPSKSGGKPLMEALNERQSHRTFVKKDLSAQDLSDLLWAANGFNREDKRTVPTSQNKQEMDVYVMLSTGVYLYDAKENILKLIEKGDLRKALGQPAISENASLSLIYVANLDKASNREAGFIDSGFIAQNVYLYCASTGLGSVVRASFTRPGLHEVLKLTEKQEITIVQAVGHIK